ncbi:MAG: hypothetical protein GF344_16605 [Chitinivibrionales bacterium]|nr:hypothetical protein [Chitinivibrionales bacterium]MBD3358312.1 hypothetical protein [Chitinivibrionales bacterium]
MMAILAYILGPLLVLVTVVDVFITVFSTRGAGPISRTWTRLLWRALLFIHARRPIHGVLAFTGPFMLLGSIVIWYAFIGLGLFTVFAANPHSVMNSTTGQPVEWIQKVYFVNTTISSLGYGDIVPANYPWTLMATAATFIATIVLTVSISYVLSVVGAAIERKKLAQAIYGLGMTIPEIINHSRLNDAGSSLKNYITTIASSIDDHALKHLAYPLLKYFHSHQYDASPVRAILLFSDTFFLLGLLPPNKRPPVGVLRLVNGSIGNYANLTQAPAVAPKQLDQAPRDLLEYAREHGIAVDGDVEFRKALESYLFRRRTLLALCYEDGWYEK